MYRRCYGPGALLKSEPLGSALIGDEVKTYRRHYTTKDYTPWAYNKKLLKEDVNPLGYCTFGLPMIDYINREDVRHLLHIPDEV